MSDESLSPVLVDAFTHHEIYYWTEGVVFLVENLLFKVPRDPLMACSSAFASMFSLPSAVVEEGVTDAFPVRLEQVKAIDFERLLGVIYPRIAVDGYHWASWGTNEWASVLHLASVWQMDDIRKMAIKYINTIGSSAAKIRLGRKYDHPLWVSEGVVDLCLRPDPLTEDDALELEMKDIIGCSSVREKVRARVLEPESNPVRSAVYTRHGSAYIRKGIYQDGMVHRANPYVRSLIEDTFGVDFTPPQQF